jgi:hypothetical protein
VACLAVASASTIFRSPAHDTAVIKSDRVGGSFSYSVAENQAYGVVSPVVSHVTSPVATTYTVQQQPSYVGSHANVIHQTSPVVEVNNVVPTNQQVVSAYTSLGHNYWYGNADNSPIVYNSNVNGIEVEKQIEQVPQVQVVQQVVQPVQALHQVQPIEQVQPVTYVQAPITHQVTEVQQPITSSVVTSLVQPQVVASPVATTYAVQQHSNSIHVQGPTSYVSSPVAYSTVQRPVVSNVVSSPVTYSAVHQGSVPLTYSAVHQGSVVSSPVTYSAVHQGSVPVTYSGIQQGVSPVGLQYANAYGYHGLGFGNNVVV